MGSLPCIGSVCWLCEPKIAQASQWANLSQTNFVPMQVRVDLGNKPWKIDFENTEDLDRLSDEPNIFARATERVQERCKHATAQFEKIKVQVTDLLNRYKSLKTKSIELKARSFYEHLRDNRDMRSKIDAYTTDFSLKVPHASLFNQDPFVETLVETLDKEEISSVKERQIRDYLQSCLQSQIMIEGKKIAENFYDAVVFKLIGVLIADKFGITAEKFVQLLHNYVKTQERRGDRLDNRLPAKFLMKDNFTAMYVGGTVLACAPLLYGMIAAPLAIDSNPSDDLPKTYITVAKDHYSKMGSVGNGHLAQAK